MAQPTRYGDPERFFTGTADLPLKGPLPKGKTLSGTFSSSGTIVTGVATKFNTELAGVKGWLYSTSLNQLREFQGCDNDNYLHLLSPFTTNVANEPMVVCFIRYTIVTISNLGPNPGLVKERLFPAGEIETYPNDAGIAPITYDFTANGVSGALILLQH
jgi:hypothetical protein